MKRILLIALVLFVLGAVALLTSLNSIVAAAVEKAGTAALGVETTLDDADLGLMTAEARLTDLRVANPAGFGELDFFGLERAVFDLRAPSVFGDVIRIPLIRMEGARLSLVQKGTASNVATILGHLEGVSAGGGGGDAGGDPDGGKRFHVESIVLEEITVDVVVDLLGEGTRGTTATLVIPRVEVADVGTAEEGAPLREVVGEVVEALLSATLEADGGSILDGTLRKQLEDGLDDLERRGRDVLEGGLDEVRDRIDETLDGVLDDAKNGLEEQAGKILEGLGGDGR